jgi:hypothetical protein
MGFMGGVVAEQMSADVFRIKARGNAYTEKSTVGDYMLLKAAETAKNAGGTHFQVISATDASKNQVVNSPGSVNTSVYGNTAFTTYSPPSSTVLFKPGQDAYIKVLRLPTGEPPPANVFAADDIIQFIGGRVNRG